MNARNSQVPLPSSSTAVPHAASDPLDLGVVPATDPGRNGDRLSLGIVAGALLVCLCQVGIGARYSATGEQLGMAVPVSTVALFAALGVQGVRRKLPALPTLSPWVPLFLIFTSAGVLASQRAGLKLTVKELFQLVEIVVIMPWLAQSLPKDERKSLLTLLGFTCPLMLLLLATGLNAHPWIRLSNVKASVFAVASLPMLVGWVGGLFRQAAGCGTTIWRTPRATVLASAGLIAVNVGAGEVFASGGLLLVWVFLMAISVWCLLPEKRVGVAIIGIGAALLVTVSILLPGPSAWHSLHSRYDDTHPTRTALEAQAAWRGPRHLPLGGGLGTYKASINRLKLFDSRTPHPDDLKVMENSTNQYLLTLVESGLPAAVVLFVLLAINSFYSLRGPRTGNAESEDGRQPDKDFPENTALSLGLLGFVCAGFFAAIFSRGSGLWAGAFLGLTVLEQPIAKRVTRLTVPAVYLALALAAAFIWNTYRPSDTDESRLSLLARHIMYKSADHPFGLVVVPVEAGGRSVEGVVFTEAEAGEAASPFVVIPAADISGGRVLSLPMEAEKGVGEAKYQVEVPADGTYRLAAKVWWSDGCSNSVAFQVGSERLILSSGEYGRWHTLKSPRLINLPAGPLTLSILAIETGVQIDWWELVPVE
ncbi:MAG: hypothetical protein RRC34_15185 [Lentisphaeria bacterium]|nr:hypothetical protein [Lentisphaeria bacterium]